VVDTSARERETPNVKRETAERRRGEPNKEEYEVRKQKPYRHPRSMPLDAARCRSMPLDAAR
jgi:hypothetical protein